MLLRLLNACEQGMRSSSQPAGQSSECERGADGNLLLDPPLAFTAHSRPLFRAVRASAFILSLLSSVRFVRLFVLAQSGRLLPHTPFQREWPPRRTSTAPARLAHR